MDNGKRGIAELKSTRRDAKARSQALTDARQGGFLQWLLRRLFEKVGNPSVQIILWNGESYMPPTTSTPVARLYIRDRSALWRLMVDPELYFGDAYAAGQIEVKGDLVEFLVCVYRAIELAGGRGPAARILARGLYRPHSTSVDEARDNIHAHYDLGNDFYRLWLDREMVYTCAYYPREGAMLEEAQAAKMHHVCRKLRLRPGESVVETGCGWGSLALFMARHYGVKVRAYNISREQIAVARARARDEGLADRVEFVEDDYRNVAGNYDAFVSIGMLEHVGPKYFSQLGQVIDSVLKDNGRGLIHSIGRVQPGPMNSWIERRIFPGAHPPSIAEMMAIFEPHRFSVLDIENLRMHYARTCRHWLERFDGVADRVERMFDRRFVRTWRLYLAGSIASFLAGELQLYQVVFNRHSDNEVPLTREHLYTNGHGKSGICALPMRPAANSSE
ncbi:MAG: cyclopropane-fatty-acyl-phospholipid synthase family protein [Chromatiales bacterium]|jgi:cyclopropane-fatty-acyl-phospholipid synthase|nr:cyclopropane-fatty-acyl-phospholipid synthase family protein [Chromatiales bacterium]